MINAIMSILPMSAFAAQNLPESEHPYADNMSETWVYNGKKGTKAMSVTFSDDTEVENVFDIIEVTSSNLGTIGRFTGRELAGRTLSFNDSDFSITLTSDNSDTGYGFKVTKVVEYNSERVFPSVKSDEYCDVIEDTDSKTITFRPSSKNVDGMPLNFDIINSVYWVEHIVIEEGFTGDVPALYKSRSQEVHLHGPFARRGAAQKTAKPPTG